MKLTSKVRVDVLPNKTARIDLKESLASLEGDAVTLSREGVKVISVGKNYVEVANTGNKTYSVFENDQIGDAVQMAQMETSEVEDAFEVTDEVIRCPLCDKEYKNSPQGESWFQRHMETEHGTRI